MHPLFFEALSKDSIFIPGTLLEPQLLMASMDVGNSGSLRDLGREATDRQVPVLDD